MMERRCSCCNHPAYSHRAYNERGIEARQPSPIWPLVLLGLVFALLMGPNVLEPPEDVFSISQVGAFFMLLPFVLLAFYFLSSDPLASSSSSSSSSSAYDYHTHNYPSSYNYTGYPNQASTSSEEPLYGWGIFFMFILAIILLPLSRS